MNPWKWTLIFLCIWGQNFGCERHQLPSSLRQLCICRTSNLLVCKNINSSAVFQTSKPSVNDISNTVPVNPFQTVTELHIEDSNFKKGCLNPKDFEGFHSLNSLSVISSGLKSFLCENNKEETEQNFSQLKELDLSKNQIKDLNLTDSLVQLVKLNVSHNHIKTLAPRFFAQFKQLVTLDLSNNQLDEHLQPSVFQTLPKSLEYLDISSKYIKVDFRC